MLKFNKEVFLATELLGRVSKEPKAVRSIAERLGTTEFFLQRIVGKLRKAGLVSVRKGPGGGVYRNADRIQITVLDVMKALGPVHCGVKDGSFLAAVHNDVSKLLGALEVPLLALETGDVQRGEALK